jgi:hypothetical protein
MGICINETVSSALMASTDLSLSRKVLYLSSSHLRSDVNAGATDYCHNRVGVFADGNGVGAVQTLFRHFA